MSENKNSQDVAWAIEKGQDMGVDYKRWMQSARRARLAPLLTLAACALILLGIAALDRFHGHQFEQTMRLVRDFEQTRTRLLASFQRLSVDSELISVSEQESEREALLQELRQLQASAEAMRTGPQGAPNMLGAHASALAAQLESLATPSIEPQDRPGLQKGFLALDAEMVRLESSSARELEQLLGRQQIQYSVGWLFAVVAMALLGLAVARNNREVLAAQTALRESETHFQRLLNMLPQLVWTCDASGAVEYLNQRWSDYSGLSLPEIKGHGWTQLVHPDDLDTLLAQWTAVGRTGDGVLSEFRMRRRDGVYRWFSVHFGASRNEHGQAVRWFGSSIDVDDVRSTRAALEHSERFYREALNSLNEGIIIFDAARRVTGCNPSAERIWGLSRASLMNLSYQFWDVSLKDEEGREIAWTHTPVARVLATDAPCRDMVIQLLQRSGKEYWLLVSAEPIRGSDGNITAIVATYRDVTERKRTQLELRQHQEQLESTVAERTRALTAEIGARSLVEQQLQALNAQLLETERFNRLVADNIPGRIAYWDHDVRCQFVNKTYCEWFDSTPEQILGRTMREARGDAYFESLREHIAAALRGEPQEFERTDPGRDGVPMVSRVQYVPDMRNGQVQGFFVLAVDLTQQKKAEQQLQLANDALGKARDRATSDSKAKSAFLANMSHEIRTPMNAIIGFTYMLRRDAQDSLQQQRLHKINTAANHLLQVVNDILDLSKIEAGQLVLEMVDFSLDALLTRSCSMVVEMARDKGLELVVDIETLPDRLHGDPTRLMQALLNLLSNAVKFTETGSVTLRVVLLEQDGEAVLIRFEVVDTGIGIAPAEFARLFNPFAQAESSSTRLHVGTGLGLAITRHIAGQMGGEAGGESKLEEGSRFWFTAKLRHAAHQAALPAPVLRGLRALVADDLAEARHALTAMLEGLGMRVDSVPNGTLALEAFANAHDSNDPYNVVLLDWAMPGLDGLEIGVRLSDSLAPPQAMVLVSTRDHVSMHQLARDAGFGAVLMKPVTSSMLLDCLMRLLKGGARLDGGLEVPVTEDYRLPDQHLGTSVLLVEDNPVNQEVASQLLQAAGLHVDVAGDGQQAVQMVRRNAYDLVLMDVQMPRMDGLQATRLLRQDPVFAQLPIIAMTANAMQEDRQACMDAGMNDHLAKPVEPRQLHLALMRWLPAQKAPLAQTVPTPPLAALSEVAVAPERAQRSPEEKLASMDKLVDLNQAYEYCAGQASILLGVMVKFTGHYQDAGHRLMGHLDTGQMDEASRLLHSLRGVSATIGASEILARTKELERAIKENAEAQELASLATRLCRELDALVAAIAEQLGD